MTYSTDRQPDYEDRLPRGLGKKTIMLAAIEEETGGDEKEFFKKVIRIGLGDTKGGQQPVPMLLSEAMKRLQPPLKPTGEKITLNIAEGATHAQKCESIFLAVTSGSISAEHGQMLVGMIKDSIVISESTDRLERLEKIEQLLAGKA
jgi:hypothetical protein